MRKVLYRTGHYTVVKDGNQFALYLDEDFVKYFDTLDDAKLFCSIKGD